MSCLSRRVQRGFANLSDVRDIPTWCVGEATAEAACEAGLAAVKHADGNAGDLFERLVSQAAKGTRFLHLGNEAAAGDLSARLSEAGLPSRFKALYRMQNAKALSNAASRAIQSGLPLGVLIHSAKGAESFLALSKDMPLGALHVVSISPRAAAPLADAGFGELSIAIKPTEAAMLAKLTGE